MSEYIEEFLVDYIDKRIQILPPDITSFSAAVEALQAQAVLNYISYDTNENRIRVEARAAPNTSATVFLLVAQDVNTAYRRARAGKGYDPEARTTLGEVEKNLREYIDRNKNKIRSKVTPRGAWRHIPSLQSPFHYSCSLCQLQISIPPEYHANYCPNCGARMNEAD